MTKSKYPAYPPDVTEEQAQFLLTNLNDCLFPRQCFDEGFAIQKAYNELYSAIARDEEWLKSIVEELVEVDDFVAKLWQVHLDVKKEGYVQDLTLGLFRSDYMVHLDPSGGDAKPQIKQVEFNTIASSFGGLSTQVSALHRYLNSVDAYPAEVGSLIKQDSLPRSQSDPERNVFDQRHLEYSLFVENGVRVFRVPFSNVLSCTELDSERNLIYHPPHTPGKAFEVTTIYYRAGYSPDDFPTDTEWTLAGCKKVQQVLATPHSPHLARFLPNESTAARVLQTFAPIYPMDKSEAGQEARRLATNVETAQRYVLKPQREGGGNNIYRGAIPPFLSKLPESHWPAYILMEMIEPPAQSNVIIRNGEVQKGG
ncbi:putative glutathione synthetase [Diplodia seriata]|uniref:Glutathione synthetase n=1 Tax=Diplodia seriata TaxID=420778 RepID=A0A0G2GV95_9PEZI|nr:putative glutathione synthetase [Diplodia seriata]